jgi:hypothetical protein
MVFQFRTGQAGLRIHLPPSGSDRDDHNNSGSVPTAHPNPRRCGIVLYSPSTSLPFPRANQDSKTTGTDMTALAKSSGKR